MRWGIAGTGGISTAFARALTEVEGAEVAAFGTRDPMKASRLALEHEAWAESYTELFNDQLVEIVYIGTPASHHYRHAHEAIEAGKHVLVEKPFTTNRAQAEALATLAAEHGVFLMEAQWPRFLPAYAHLRDLLADGAVGEVRMVEAAFGGRSEWMPRNRAFRPDLAGGTLMDVTVYPIAFAHFVLGAPSSVGAFARMRDGIDTENVVTMRWDDGQLGIASGATLTTLDGGARIYGTEGMIVVPGNHNNPAYLDVHYPGFPPTHIDCLPSRDRLAYQAIAVQDYLAAGLTESPLMPVAESVAVMGTLDRVREQIGLRFPDEAEAL